jgi:sarcosine oxidase/L-pipecolate oxidase
LFSKEQIGFLPGRSIQDAVLNLLYDLNSAMNKKQYSVVVFLDYSKAFDTVMHNILLKKLYRYGFRDCINEFLKSYFSHRKQNVIIKDYDSTTLDVCMGVPQGSSLGPLFYLIFVNEFSKLLNFCKGILYMLMIL